MLEFKGIFLTWKNLWKEQRSLDEQWNFLSKRLCLPNFRFCPIKEEREKHKFVKLNIKSKQGNQDKTVTCFSNTSESRKTCSITWWPTHRRSTPRQGPGWLEPSPQCWLAESSKRSSRWWPPRQGEPCGKALRVAGVCRRSSGAKPSEQPAASSRSSVAGETEARICWVWQQMALYGEEWCVTMLSPVLKGLQGAWEPPPTGPTL